MNIQKISASTPVFKKNYNFKKNYSNTTIQNDSFIKQNQNISFTGFKKNKKSIFKKKEDNLYSSIKDLKLNGANFLYGLASSIAIMKMGEKAEELLFDSDGYTITENGINSNLITIDDKKGIIEFEGTGIKIDTSDYDIVDWDNGIFKNYDGSVDIDLSNNKFIDAENGIFVDPIAKISAVLDGEYLQSLAIPDLTFRSGHDLFPFDGDDDQPIKLKSEKTLQEEENAYNKFLKSIIKGEETTELGTDTGLKDIFGDDIITASDKDGDTYLSSYSRFINDDSVFACFKRPISKENLSEAINEIRLQKYMDENHQNFGTRLQVYEGGRNALIPEIIAEYRGYDREIADRVIDQIESNSDYIPEPGSEEAINFAKFQDHMLRIGIFKDPIIAPNYLVGDSDLDGDKISDFDKDGDNLLDFSSEIGLGERIIDFFKNILDTIAEESLERY